MGTKCSKPRRLAPASPLDPTTLHPSSHSTANSAFFQKLPAELRKIILTEAFGNRTLHIQNRRFVCICRRPDVGDDGIYAGPSHDRCLRLCEKRGKSEQQLEDYAVVVGAVGWLRSCRLAYLEGTQILHQTNTLHIRIDTVQEKLTDHIPTFFLPSLTSLELILYLDVVDNPPNGMKLLQSSLLDPLPTTLPNLRSLYVGDLGGGPICEARLSPKERFLLYEEEMLGPMDRVARGFGGVLGRMEVGLPTSGFFPGYVMGLGEGEEVEAPYWRFETEVTHPRAMWSARDRYWRVVGGEGGDARGYGYWVSGTVMDMPFEWVKDGMPVSGFDV